MARATKNILQISCIVPAYNEEKQIGAVLNTVLQAARKIPMEIIVIDDGSTDRTPDILKTFKGIKVIANKPNKGKSYSVARGIEASTRSHVLLLDADLSGLSDENIYALIAPVQDNVAQVAMSVRRNSSLFDSRNDKLDLITGERVFPRDLVSGHMDEIKKLPNFGLEVYLNNLIIERGCAVKAVHWNNVLNETKSKKRGFYSGWKANIGATRDVSQIVSFVGLIRQYIALRKLLVK